MAESERYINPNILKIQVSQLVKSIVVAVCEFKPRPAKRIVVETSQEPSRIRFFCSKLELDLEKLCNGV